MILIAHRGNLAGPLSAENKPEYVKGALDQGFEVEVDVWWNGDFYLGHEKPLYKISTRFLKENPLLWCHAKTPQTLERLLALYVNCFYIEDMWKCVLTSTKYIWTSPGHELTPRSIAVMPEYSHRTKVEIQGAAGVCSDYIEDWW
jgi:hypothetical protein